MATKSTEQSVVPNVPSADSRNSAEISAQAMQAWSRLPTSTKVEILAAVEHVSPISDTNVKTVEIGNQLLTVKKLASGFRVFYEQGTDHNTIVSVLTPREAGLVAG